MKKLALIIVLAGWLATFAFAKEIDVAQSKGTGQSVIVSLTPEPASYEADRDAALEAVFNVPLDASSVQKNNVKLKKIAETQETMIDGDVAYDTTQNTVVFTPDALLEEGYYEVEFKSLKPTKEYKDQQIKEIKYRFYVPEVINGHKLPPEPDAATNNATLLGIDINDNGVRDDVERYIIIRYASDPKYSKTKTAIALQYAWASQKVLENPTIESKKHIDDALDCQYYWVNKETDKYTNSLSGFEKGQYRRSLKILTDPSLKDHIYNTHERIERKFSFNAALSGNIFDGRKESIENCQVDINALGE
ncbi:MAG: Ig-like domain-containing protein [Sulfurovum sp.]|jgi:hypothetical protein|nr:Ig-like domain-containing protein [Sulfurovum sp.]